jgi:hypothetical protein
MSTLPYTIRKFGGDDLYSWALFRRGDRSPICSGMSKDEAEWRRDQRNGTINKPYAERVDYASDRLRSVYRVRRTRRSYDTLGYIVGYRGKWRAIRGQYAYDAQELGTATTVDEAAELFASQVREPEAVAV